MKNDKIGELITLLKKEFNNPTIELNYTTQFSLLVAVILSAQATDIGVNKATKFLFPKAQTPEEFQNLGYENLLSYISSINYYRVKARYIIGCANSLLGRCDIPDNMEDLIKLPGIGIKSASVLLNVIWKKPIIAVDTHVFRVTNRVGICSTKTPEATAKIINKIISEDFKNELHHLLVLHGRYICKAKKPNCTNCKINHLCKFNLR